MLRGAACRGSAEMTGRAPLNVVTSSPSQHALRPQRELLIAWTLLLLDEEDAHGYALHQRLLATGSGVQATSLYRLLSKLERDRLLVSRWSASVDGPRRHVYHLTEHGQAALREMSGMIAEARESYRMFVDAHADAVARRSTNGVDEAAAPVPRKEPAPKPGTEVTGPPAQRPMRPHKELLVGWLLLQLDAGATYGYDLQRGFYALRLNPDPAAMYRMLRRMEADKWVQSRWVSPATGPRRRFYRLTGRGRRNLDEIARLIAAIQATHDSYLQAYEHAQARERSDERATRPGAGARSRP